MNEWRPVKGFEGIYEVHSTGIVRSLDRVIVRKDGVVINRRGRVLSNRHWAGYEIVNLSKDGNRNYDRMHRIVAEAFIPNPKGLPHVNHIDGDKGNNHFDNLEWVTRRENMEHAQTFGLSCPPKPVLQIKNGRVVHRFSSLTRAAASIGSTQSDIRRTCNGEYKQWKGYEWRYAETQIQ